MSSVSNNFIIAVLGIGSIGKRHLSVFKQMRGVVPIAVSSRIECLSELEEKGFLVASSLNDAFQKGAACCIVATDTRQHCVDAKNAMELGLDILVEKPMAENAETAAQIYHMAQKKNRKVFVGCVLRFSDSLNYFRNLLPQIGPLHSVNIECRSYLPDWRPDRPYQQSYSARKEDGGVLRDLIHEIDYAGWLFGWPTVLQAKIRNLGILNIQSEETADLSWEVAEGCLVTIGLDYLSKPPRRQMTAYGKTGTLQWDGIKGEVILSLQNQPPQTYSFSQARDEMFLKQAEAFLSSTSDVPFNSVLATAEEGIKALAVCDAARLASQNRQETLILYPI